MSGVEAGHLSFDHLGVVNFTAARLPKPLQAEADKALTPHAKNLDPSRLAVAGRFLRSQLDPEGTLSRYELDAESRYLELSQTFHWTEPHHLEHWIDGGKTKLPNLASLCRRHHRLVHEGRWKLQRRPDGRCLPELPP